jgi:predicted nucleic acid-binding protein
VATLVDTGGLVALGDRADRFHGLFSRFFRVEPRREAVIVPITVLPEVDYLVTQRAGPHVAADLVERIIGSELHVEHLVPDDFPRIVELMRQYADSNIGFVDASLVAVAERLNVRKILTLDRRHFGPIRPRHCPALEILP